MQGDIRFGRNLKILRSRKEISQQELADKIHVTRQTVSCWERGEGKPDIYCVNDICQIFKISMDEIVCGNVVKGETAMIYEEKETFTEVGYIKGITEKGFYSIIDEDLHEFFPIIEIDFPRIMVIAMELKREDYDVREVYGNGFSLYIESDEKAEKFSSILYDIIDSFIHHDNEYIEENLEKISNAVYEVHNRIIDNVMSGIWGKAPNKYKYYWVDMDENPRGYADTKEECERQAKEQECTSYEVLPLI